MEILNTNPTADLKVYAVWYNMYPGDDRSKWDEHLLTDPRVTHLWDEEKLVGRFMVAEDVVQFPREIVWDAYLLFGPDAHWDETPDPLISWGQPVYHRRHQLRHDLEPLLEVAPVADTPEHPESVEIAAAAPSERPAPTDYDLMVLGGGAAGFAAAIRGAELGRRIALVEAGTLGGVCVNVGCIPSKTILRAAQMQHQAGHHPFRGAVRVSAAADWAAVVQHKDELVAEMRKTRYEDVLDVYPEITLIRGWARLLGGNRVEVTPVDEGGAGVERFETGSILLATGSHSWAPPIKGLEESGYLDSTAALEMTARPASMIVVGASSVGLEVAQAYARFGTKVTVLEISDDIVPAEESEIAGELTDYLRQEGLVVETNVFITEVQKDDGGYRVTAGYGADARVFQADALLMATGRRANTSDMGLEAAGVQLGKDGEIVVDEYLQTTNPSVYAAGDVSGQEMFVYVAAYSGKLVADNALNRAKRVYDTDVLPRVTFTDPAVAAVGLTEEQAYDVGYEVKVTSLPLEYVSRALADRDTRGLIKLVADKNTDRLLGAHVLAAGAGEVIQPAVVALKAGMTVMDLQNTFFPYLTMAEGLKLAAISFDKDPAMLSCCAG